MAGIRSGSRFGFRTTHARRVLWTDFETGRIQPHDLLLEIVGSVERVVSDIHIASECKCKFTVSEEFGGDWSQYEWRARSQVSRTVVLVEPEEKRAIGKETPVKSVHDLRRGSTG